MNKTRRFKAWDKVEEKFIEPGWWGVQSSTGRMFENSSNYIPFDPKERFVVVEYTGATDKEGRDIFQSDLIVSASLKENNPNWKKYIREVKWSNETCGWNLSPNKGEYYKVGNRFKV